MRAVGVSHEELTKMKKEKINLKVNEWEERRRRTEVEERETLEIYRAKNKIVEEGLYSNDSPLWKTGISISLRGIAISAENI